MAAVDTELRLNLLARDQTGSATRSAARNLDGVADAADDAAASTDKLAQAAEDAAEQLGEAGDAADDAADGADELGRSTRTAARHVATLDSEIDKVKQDLVLLAEQMAEAGDAAERIDISRGIRRAEQDLKRLNKSRGLLAALIPEPAEAAAQAAKVGTAIGTEAGSSATTALARSSKPMIPVLAGVAIAAAPVMGATIAAAIVGGAGVGGVVGGVVLASRDARVKKAGTVLGLVLLEDLETRAQKQFVEPVLASITRIQRGYAAMGGDLDRIFTNSARFVDPLTNGLLGFMQQVTGGIADLTDAAGPVVDALSHGIADLGVAIGDVFTSLQDNGVDAAVALHQVFQLLEGTIRGVGAAINVLTESYGFLAKLGAFGRDAQLEYLRLEANATIAADANTRLAGEIGDVKTAGEGTATAIGELSGKMSEGATSAYGQRDAIVSLNNALRAQTDPVFGLLDAQGRLKEAQDRVSDATKKHGQNSDEAKDALRRQAEAILEVQGRAGELGAAFDGKLTPALRATLASGGMTTAQIDALEKQFREAKKAGDKFAVDYNATATLRFRVFGQAMANAALNTAQLLSGYREAGGPVKAGHAYVVGEKRAEVFVPDTDGKILPSVDDYNAAGGGRSAGTGGSGGSGGGSRTVRHTFDVTGAEGKFVEWLRYIFNNYDFGFED